MPFTEDKALRLYDEICDYARQTSVLASINEVLGWDERTQMPPAGAEHRARQSTLLAGLIHQRWIEPKFGDLLDELSQILQEVDPGGDRATVVRRLKRQRDKRVKLPKALVEEFAGTAVAAQQVWQQAREKNDFPAFRPWLEKTIQLKSQQAEALGYSRHPYDALLDEYEPETLTVDVDQVLTGLREQLVPLAAEIQHSGRRPDVSFLHREFPMHVQEQFGCEAAAAIGFDFTRGRLDVTAHPFCTALGPHDCRITTRYNEHFFPVAFFGILHEAGHGLYEQGLPCEHYGLPLGEAISLGIHESQSRLWENFVGRGRPFWGYFYPLAQDVFPTALGDISLDEFYFAINDVRPSLIRVEADEVTYNLHILVRFELERAMLDGNLSVADLPAAWNDKYEQYLGVVPADDRTGVLQDVHWAAGLIGYFPTYALGNLYAAQFYSRAQAEIDGLDRLFAQGDFYPLTAWLRQRVHSHGQRWSAGELVQRVTGNPLSPTAFIDYLRVKMAPLYGL